MQNYRPPYIDRTPGDINFFYREGSTTYPSAQNVITPFDCGDATCSCASKRVRAEITYLQGNGWLNINSQTVGADQDEFEFGVITAGYATGDYTAHVAFIWECLDAGGGVISEIERSDDLIVRFSIMATDYLIADSVLGSYLIFSHELGTTLPTAQTVQINSNVAWTASSADSELDFTPTSGTNDDVISVGLSSDADSLAAGNHLFEISLTDGTLTATITVAVIITDAVGFAYQPSVLTFEWLRGAALPASQFIHIFSDADWEITDKPAWLSISQMSGSTSAAPETRIINVTGMAPGTYTDDIILVEDDGTEHTINVQLIVFDFLKTPIKDGGLYFSKDKNYLDFNSNRDNTFIEMSIEMNIHNFDNTVTQTQRTYNLPLFQRKGQFHPGAVIHQLFAELQAQNIEGFHPYDEFRPVNHFSRMFITIKEKDITTGDVYFQSTLQEIKWLKGIYKSTALTTSYALKRMLGGWIQIPLYDKFGTGYIEIECVGNPPFSTSNNYDIQEFSTKHTNMQEGSIAEYFININTPNLKFLMVNPSGPVNAFHFINSFGVREILRFDGAYSFNAKYTHKTNTKHTQLYEHKENHHTTVGQILKQNTGWLLEGELPVLNDLMKSRVIWLIGDEVGEITLRPISKQIATKNSEEKLFAFDLEFEIIDNTDDYIYPRSN